MNEPLEEFLIFGVPIYLGTLIIAILKDMMISTYKIILWLIILLFLGCTYWFGIKPTSDGFKGLGLNLFTELLGIAFTIFIVEFLIKRENDRIQLPRKYFLYNELTARISNYVGGCKTFFAVHVPAGIEYPKTLEEFFNHNFMQILWIHIDLKYIDSKNLAGYENGYDNSHGSRIEFMSKYVIKTYENLIVNFGDLLLEEDLYYHVNQVVHSSFLYSCSNLKRNNEQFQENTVDRNLDPIDKMGLGYIKGVDMTPLCQSMIYIHNWCRTFYSKNSDNKNLYKPYDYEEHLPERHEVIIIRKYD